MTTAPAPARLRPVAPVAVVPLAIVTALMAIPLLLTANRYGYAGDELYFLAAGRHLAWGYVDQPPLLPLLAKAMDALGHSPFVLRVPAMLAVLAGIALTALIARELGGGAKAQTLAAATFGVSPGLLMGGHYLATSTVDPFLWTLVLWLLTRWLRTHADGLLVWAGLVTAIALYTKFLIGGFWLAAGVAVFVCGPRELLRRSRLWLGAAIAAVALVPTLLWQATHGWPQLGMGAAISAEVDDIWGGRVTFVPGALLIAGLPVGVVMLCYGLWRLLRSRELRFLGWTVVLLTVVFLAVNGRFYYLAGMYPVCWAMAAVALEREEPARWWRWIATWPCYTLSALLVLPVALPVWPRAWLTEHPSLPAPLLAYSEIGSPEAARSVADAFARLPKRDRTAVVTETYWEASALDRYGRDLGLPEPASGNRGYATLVVPSEETTDVLFVGTDPGPLLGHFADLRPLGKVDTGAAKPSYFDGVPLWLASGRTEPWSVLWPKLVNTHA